MNLALEAFAYELRKLNLLRVQQLYARRKMRKKRKYGQIMPDKMIQRLLPDIKKI